MKKLIFKKWTQDVITGIGFINFFLLASLDIQDLKIFVISKLINIALIVICALLLAKYGRKEEI